MPLGNSPGFPRFHRRGAFRFTDRPSGHGDPRFAHGSAALADQLPSPCESGKVPLGNSQGFLVFHRRGALRFTDRAGGHGDPRFACRNTAPPHQLARHHEPGKVPLGNSQGFPRFHRGSAFRSADRPSGGGDPRLIIRVWPANSAVRSQEVGIGPGALMNLPSEWSLSSQDSAGEGIGWAEVLEPRSGAVLGSLPVQIAQIAHSDARSVDDYT